MLIFYFTSTGNCLAVAKRIGGTLISIPQVIDEPNLHYKDDVIGIVTPIYGFGLPKMVHNFITKAKLEADYTFAIGTYGNLPGAAMHNVQKLAAKHGNRVDYTASLLMVDNYLPLFEINGQVSKLPEKKVDENLTRILSDIENRKVLESAVSLGWRASTAIIRNFERFTTNPKQAQRYIVNHQCIQCGICAKVCPSENITVTDKVTFGDHCEGCLGCVHLCPKNAIHMKSEKSDVRWRNPNVTLNEIIVANNKQK